jgi:type II secretory pathway predicted ATPase ExeA
MFLQYWGLKQQPFNNVPSETSFFRSPQHEEAFSRLKYVIDYRKGGALLTGEVGCGKTTVTKALKKSLDRSKHQFVLMANPAMAPLDFIKSLLINFGEQTINGTKPILLARLQKRLNSNAARGISTVLAVDEAHVIKNQETMDELRMLLNLQRNEEFLITLILLGQPPLLKRITQLHPLKERISVSYKLTPLNNAKTLQYIIYRLKKAGAERGLFTNEAVEKLFDYSGGIPLKINNVGDRSLLIGYMRKAKLIDTEIVTDAIEDLQQ